MSRVRGLAIHVKLVGISTPRIVEIYKRMNPHSSRQQNSGLMEYARMLVMMHTRVSSLNTNIPLCLQKAYLDALITFASL